MTIILHLSWDYHNPQETDNMLIHDHDIRKVFR